VRPLAVDPASGVVAVGGQFRSVSGVARAAWRCRRRRHRPALRRRPQRLPDAHTTSDALEPDLRHRGRRADRAERRPVRRRPVLLLGHDEPARRGAFTLATALHGWNPVASDRCWRSPAPAAASSSGGELTSVNGGVRPNLAALDATTGQLDPSFNPVVDDEVLDVAVAPGGTRLFLAGHFSNVGGKKHNRMAAVSLATGTEDRAFKPNFNNDVLSIGVVGQSVYAGGQFTKVTKVTRKHVAKIDPATGVADPAFVADTVGPNGPLTAGGMVQSLQVAPDGSKVYLAGPYNGAPLSAVVITPAVSGPFDLGTVVVRVALKVDPTTDHLSTCHRSGSACTAATSAPDNIYQWDAVHLSTPATRPGSAGGRGATPACRAPSR
jgi:hypothetical protein